MIWLLLFASIRNCVRDCDSKWSPLNNEMMAKHLKNINIATRMYSSKFIIISVFRRQWHRCWAYEWIVYQRCNIQLLYCKLCFYLYIHYTDIVLHIAIEVIQTNELSHPFVQREWEKHTQYTHSEIRTKSTLNRSIRRVVIVIENTLGACFIFCRLYLVTRDG